MEKAATSLSDAGPLEQDRPSLADISTGLLYDMGEYIHAMPFRAGAYAERTPLMHEIRADGIVL